MRKSNINAKPRQESTSVDYGNSADPDPNIRSEYSSRQEYNEEKQTEKDQPYEGRFWLVCIQNT